MSELHQLIKSSKLTANQRVRWRKRGIVPKQVLIRIIDIGVPIFSEEPKSGIHMNTLLDVLYDQVQGGESEKARDLASFLYTDIVRDMMPRWQDKRPPRKLRLNWPASKK